MTNSPALASPTLDRPDQVPKMPLPEWSDSYAPTALADEVFKAMRALKMEPNWNRVRRFEANPNDSIDYLLSDVSVYN